MTTILDIAIVTYNRLEKLKHALECYERQTSAFRNIIIVDNCSTDGTHEFLTEYCAREHTQFQTVHITTEENLGGSGGFYLGQKKALELNADWVMVADDDAYAAPDMVEQFYKYVETHDVNKTAVVCAAVYNMNGSICTQHRCWLKTEKNGNIFQKAYHIDSNIEDYAKQSYDIDITTYVGTFINSKALRSVGLVNSEYFIYHDDGEHSLRLKKYGKITVVPTIKITHENGTVSTTITNNTVTWREYYVKRNEAHMLLHHLPRTIIKDYLFLFRCMIGAWIHNTKPNIFEQIDRSAKIDALLGRLGKHKIYKPGWSYKI